MTEKAVRAEVGSAYKRLTCRGTVRRAAWRYAAAESIRRCAAVSRPRLVRRCCFTAQTTQIQHALQAASFIYHTNQCPVVETNDKPHRI